MANLTIEEALEKTKGDYEEALKRLAKGEGDEDEDDTPKKKVTDN